MLKGEWACEVLVVVVVTGGTGVVSLSSVVLSTRAFSFPFEELGVSSTC